MTAKRTPADVLREARKQDSLAKRTRVLAVVDEMKAKGEPITFLGVAKAAGVSNWLVYAEGVREHIEAARKSQAGKEKLERKAGAAASAASIATDLELARSELRTLREERDRLKAAVQRSLGQQVGQTTQTELVARIDELTTANQNLASKLSRTETDRDRLQNQLTEAQDDLIAARQALRNMMRDQNRAHD
ncbi:MULTISPECIES: DUF6262 family protein [Streptomyces violaceusniger group]|uniref:Uncharacterized protein n=2 Tax=Streptomyces rhizosphaericus TaxID=114699 RepID=A0ABN1S9J0_9ACTN|nr:MULTISPECIES: DUF6262 family protein [Streptomyces violaceusniger group]